MRNKVFQIVTSIILLMMGIGLIYYQIVKPNPDPVSPPSSCIAYHYHGLPSDTDGDWEDDGDLQ